MSRCEFDLQETLARDLTRAMACRLRQDGFKQVLEYCNPDGPDVAEFQKGQLVVAMDVRDLGGDRQMVGVSSDEYDCLGLARQAALDSAAEMAAMLLAPLSGASQDEFRRKIRYALSQLVTEEP